MRFKLLFFVVIFLLTPLFSDTNKSIINLNPQNKYQKLLLNKVDLSIKLIKKNKKINFIPFYKKNYKNFRDLFSIDFFVKKVLSNNSHRFSKKQLEYFKSLYFFYVLTLIQNLKYPPKDTLSVSFINEKINKKSLYIPISLRIKISTGASVKNFRLVFLMSKKNKLLEDAVFRKEHILESHKKQFNTLIKNNGINKFLSIFKNDIKQQLKVR